MEINSLPSENRDMWGTWMGPWALWWSRLGCTGGRVSDEGTMHGHQCDKQGPPAASSSDW